MSRVNHRSTPSYAGTPESETSTQTPTRGGETGSRPFAIRESRNDHALDFTRQVARPQLSVDLKRAALRSPTFPKWSEEKLDREIERYRGFLLLAKDHPRQALAPTKDIDEVWHLHMLHPRDYAEDCKRLFGGVLDHDGGFGASPEELPILKQVFQKTAELWERAFGEPYVAATDDPRVTNCWHDCSGRCWHACSSDDERAQ